MKPTTNTLTAGCLFVLMLSCSTPDKNQKSDHLNDTQHAAELPARKYCSSCHSFPDASVLPKDYWTEVLPIMGYFLGRRTDGVVMSDELVVNAKDRLLKNGILPSSSPISDEEWEKINRYYHDYAPVNLKPVDSITNYPSLTQFKYEPIGWKSDVIGLTYMDYRDDRFILGASTGSTNYFLEINEAGEILTRANLPTPMVDISKLGSANLLLLMGFMENYDDQTGQIAIKTSRIRTYLPKLERPVNFHTEDFDGDGSKEILVAEFGKYIGGINIYKPNNLETKTNIHNRPGCLKIIVRDVNEDGLKDFYALVAQEDESIYLFENKGGLKFDKKRLIQLPPYYGTSHFELVDFDGDGDQDIICSSGDGADFSTIYKPFHGVRIFENKGDDNYEQVWFHSQQGAYGTVSEDFDGDGDIDFASVGHLSSTFSRPSEGFIYFENKSTKQQKWELTPQFLEGVPNNCWILIQAKDIDNDGDRDLLLGANAAFVNDDLKQANIENWSKNGGVLSILRNQMIP